MGENFEKKNRKKILALISHNPGINTAKITELSNIRGSEVESCLDFFKKKEIIIVIKEANYERYYIADNRVKIRDKKILETRRKICSLIVQNPGLHLSKIAHMLDLSIPLTDYHLRYLEKNNEIIAVKDEKRYFKRYYIRGSGIDNQEKKLLEILGKKIPLKIVVLLLKHSHLKHNEIVKHLNMSSSKLSYHLTMLVNNEIIGMIPYGEDKGYRLNNRDEIIRILKKHELHIELYLTIENFKDLWDDFNY